MTLRAAATALALAAGLACAGAVGPGMSIPRPLRGFDVLVLGQDSLDRAVSAAFSRRGFTVRHAFRGGTHRTAAFARGGPRGLGVVRGGLEAWLVDTRKGTELAAVSIPADSLPSGAGPRGELIVKLLMIAAAGGGEEAP